MPQDSASRAVSLAAALLAATALGCRSKPVDQQLLVAAQHLGVTNLERGLLDDAEKQFKIVVANAPDDPLGYANLGLTYLRGGRFADAEAPLQRARRLDPANAEVGLIVARLYSLTGRATQARATLEALPRDAKVLYALARLDSLSPAKLRDVLTLVPANLAVRLQLIDLFVRRAETDSALRHLEDVRRLRPEPPPEAKPHLDATIAALHAGRLEPARAAFDRFLHVMQVTAPYQAALSDVAWTEGPLVGRPVLAFSRRTLSRQTEVHFTDVTEEAGLAGLSGLLAEGSVLALGDYDGDGADNLFVAPASFYNVQRGFAVDAAPQPGVALPAGVTYATFADYDNDGWLDLFALSGDGRGYLFRNDGTGKLSDVTAATGVGDVGDARKALFVDLDHDGDLDLLLAGETRGRVLRNNLDGTFTPAATLGRGEGAAFGDFDGDGRTDIVVGDTIYHNVGAQGFRGAPFGTIGRGADIVAAGDYDNDGALDLFVLPEPTLWHNAGEGTFTRGSRADKAFERLRGPDPHAAEFVDYDNDGWLDLVVAGTRGLSLFHNDRGGRWSDRSTLLPATVRRGNAVAIAVSDVDGDGDQDLFVAGPTGVRLLRNDGGNASLGMEVQLAALRTGSGKNNTFGIGSRIEVRAGELYQTRVATGRVTHFGLGTHLKADVLRVEWTNGVPQTVYFPGTDADVVELEQLKGSCAFLYTWDGKQFRFITDVMWQSALGMPIGIMGTGSQAYAPAGASQEYLRIPGEALAERNGRYVLQITEELWETAYLDEIKLVAVDHPDSVDLFVDERFPPAGPPRLRPYQAVDRRPPLSATDEHGRDLLPALREHDDAYVSDLTPTRYQGVVEPHDLVLDLGDKAGQSGSLLFLRGWIYPSDASINVALSQQRARSQPPSLEVRDARGRWTTAIANIGFPSGKDKTIVVELAGRFPTRDHHVRIRTNLQIYWDQVFTARDAAANLHITSLAPISAELHYRGFSRMYRRGGRYGPHWFAYDDVTRNSPWRTIQGAFTRFGDVLSLLGNADDRYVVMGPGDETTVEFTAAVTPLPPGWRRTFLLYSDGWIKDADLHTAYGDSVAPLPFHAIRSYPYAAGEAYPTDSAHLRYLRQYNTRLIRHSP